MANRHDRLWRYGRLAHMWARCLIGVALALAAIIVILQAISGELTLSWSLTFLIVTVVSLAIFIPLLRLWLGRGALPSARLPDAQRAGANPPPEAGPGDWRLWGAATAGLLFVGSGAMLLFLVGILGSNGTAEGVVVAVLGAWGLTTLRDTRTIAAAEQEQNLRYYAAGRRPLGAGNHLIRITDRAR